MHRLLRLRYVTERYEQLQGLRLVPLGIPFLLSSAWREGLFTWVPGAVLLAAASVQDVLQSPISIPSVILALGVGCLGVSGGVTRPHYLAVAATVGAFALSGALGVPFHIRDALWDRLIGMSFLVVGIGDRLLFRGTLVAVTDADTSWAWIAPA
jgi:hypothetical protein